jgi:hypothetical protein
MSQQPVPGKRRRKKPSLNDIVTVLLEAAHVDPNKVFADAKQQLSEDEKEGGNLTAQAASLRQQADGIDAKAAQVYAHAGKIRSVLEAVQQL